jgi:hypothetical protein
VVGTWQDFPAGDCGRPWICFSFGRGQYLAFATRDDSNFAALYQ